jgi:hypothetical protein
MDRDGLPLRDDGDAIRCHDARTLRVIAFAHAPAVDEADARTDSLVNGLHQAVEDTDQHEFSVGFLADIIAENTGL